MSVVNLTWLASARADTYTVYRSQFQGAIGGPIVTGLVPTSFTDVGVVNGQSYWYSVSASNIAGESHLSAQAGVTIPAIPPPPTPQTITSFGATPSTIVTGSSSTIAWVTADSTAAYLNGVPVATSGSVVVSPTVSTSYTLLVSGAAPNIQQTIGVSVTPIAQRITSFTATPPVIIAGNSSTIAWTTTNATSATLNGATVPVNGFVVRSPIVNTVYTLIASGSAPDISQSLTVSLSPGTAQTITSFTVTPPSIIAGQTVTVAWATANATLVKLNGVTVAASGSTPFTPSANTSYTLLVSGSIPDISQTKGVTVTQPAQTITSFTALPATITSGQTVTITWSTTNATAVKLNGVAVATSGSTTDNPTVNKTYTLLVSGSVPDVSQSKSVTIQPVAQTITSFTATPSFINIGSSSTLAWSTLNATSATLNGVAVGTSGTLVVAPTTTTNYTLVITGSASPVSSMISVTVQATTVLQIPPQTSFVSRFGTWTLVGGVPLLNGVATNTNSVILLELVNDDVFAFNGSFWLQYFQNDVFGTGWGPLVYFTSSENPADFILAPNPPYIGPTNTPDGWTLELTGWPAILARLGHPINQSVNPNNAEFGTDSYGINYLRFTNDPRYFNTLNDGTILISWFMSLGPNPASYTTQFTSRNMRWLMWIEDDVYLAMDEVAVKLPGLTNDQPFGGWQGLATDTIKTREIHRFPMGNSYIYGFLPECAENYIPTAPWVGGGGGAPIIDAHFPTTGTTGPLILLKPGRWHCMEQRIVLNTAGQANGIFQMWLNGNKVYERTDVTWRTDPATYFSTAFINFYHGGLHSPSSLMHYRLAKIATSSSYIGVPTELLSSYPAWRGTGAGWEVNTVHSINGTAQLNGDMPVSTPTVYPTTVGRNGYDVETWNGFAADSHGLYLAAVGGHSGQWSNKVSYCNLLDPAPRFNMRYVGSNPAPTPYDSTTGTPPIPSASAARGMFFYQDGLPCARHTYYANQYISARNRVFMFYDAGQFADAVLFIYDGVDAFNTLTNLYDAANTWTASGIYSTAAQNGPRLTVAKHPTTEDIYMSGVGIFRRWTQATATWTPVLPLGSLSRWDGRGSMIDASRNRWLIFPGFTPIMEYIDLNNMLAHTVNITDPSGQFATDIALDQFGGTAVVHDLDNDRYLLFLGVDAGNNVLAPGRIYSINPTTLVATRIASPTAPVNGWFTKVQYFSVLGGVVYLPTYDSNLQFLVTR